jgi:LmbE family N-acetylglucosaminyl deacetylase
MKAICVVAHPDDCVIAARPFIDNHTEYTWHIVYMTYNANDDRAKEVSAYWNARDITTEFLGFLDDYRDQETQKFNFWTETEVTKQIQLACKDTDLILTHNADGDYGHIHHKLVHRAVSSLDTKQVYFASTFNYNKKYMAQGDLPLELFPLHRDVIEQMTDINCGLYIE